MSDDLPEMSSAEMQTAYGGTGKMAEETKVKANPVFVALIGIPIVAVYFGTLAGAVVGIAWRVCRFIVSM